MEYRRVAVNLTKFQWICLSKTRAGVFGMKNSEFVVFKNDSSTYVFFNQIWCLDKMMKIFLFEYTHRSALLGIMRTDFAQIFTRCSNITRNADNT